MDLNKGEERRDFGLDFIGRLRLRARLVSLLLALCFLLRFRRIGGNPSRRAWVGGCEFLFVGFLWTLFTDSIFLVELGM